MDWEFVSDIARSNFFVALFASVAGAYFGAYAAQRASDKANRRRDLTKEIRQTNAAIASAYSIFNAGIAAKRQHIAPLNERYARARTEALKALEAIKRDAANADREIRFLAEMLALPLLRLPGAEMRSQVFDHLTITGRPLTVAIVIAQTSSSLDEAIHRRNMLIERFKTINDNRTTALLYFGIADSQGQKNTEYPDALYAMSRYTDDSIFFSKLLALDLRTHGLRLKEKYETEIGGESPEVAEIDFKDKRIEGLVPPKSEYRDWFDNFPLWDSHEDW